VSSIEWYPALKSRMVKILCKNLHSSFIGKIGIFSQEMVSSKSSILTFPPQPSIHFHAIFDALQDESFRLAIGVNLKNL
jgi:hypothetical protein